MQGRLNLYTIKKSSWIVRPRLDVHFCVDVLREKPLSSHSQQKEKLLQLRVELLFAKIVTELNLLSAAATEHCLESLSQLSPDLLLGEVYIQKGYLTKQQVMDILDLLNKALRKLHELMYYKVAIEKGFLDDIYLKKGLEDLGDLQPKVYGILAEQGVLNQYTHQEISQEQQRRIREMPIERLQKAILNIIGDIKKSGKPLGLLRDDFIAERALGLEWIDLNDLRRALNIQILLAVAGKYKSIGKIMVETKILSPQQIHELEAGVNSLSPIAGYQILRKVGQGAMGMVYKALRLEDKREVALKILHPKFAKNQEDLARFLRGAKLSLSLNHPNILRSYDFGQVNDIYYQAIEFIRGETVMEYLERTGPIDEVICLTIVAEVAAALAYLDAKGLVHRDVKPHNIMMTHLGEIKLTDLGIILDKQANTKITAEGISIGSPHYISPEQAMGEDLDIRSDFYSLGATMYHMLTGEYPYQGRSGAEILYKQVHNPPPNPLEKRPNISPQVASLVLKLMAKKPSERFQTPKEFIDAIRDCLADLT
ncbi:MAG: serine/threonine protein kinase [Planctomycetota bacterium]|nr:MAG: serine/threonine protein kinase [Planctomycetota bacterium]